MTPTDTGGACGLNAALRSSLCGPFFTSMCDVTLTFVAKFYSVLSCSALCSTLCSHSPSRLQTPMAPGTPLTRRHRCRHKARTHRASSGVSSLRRGSTTSTEAPHPRVCFCRSRFSTMMCLCDPCVLSGATTSTELLTCTSSSCADLATPDTPIPHLRPSTLATEVAPAPFYTGY
jgi:hypothetical protein